MLVTVLTGEVEQDVRPGMRDAICELAIAQTSQPATFVSRMSGRCPVTDGVPPTLSHVTTPDAMRAAMTDYIRTVHQAYLSQTAGQPPAVRGRLPLLAGPFTVIAAGVRNLHVVATTEALPPPAGQEIAVSDELDELLWTTRFYDPVVLPALGMIDESEAPASAQVRRTLGVSTYLYHLIVQPGSQLTGHHAGHAGAGLAMSHVADARDFEAIRAHARGRESLVDEMEGAALAGLVRAQALLAREIVPGDETVAALADSGRPEPAEVRRAVLAAVRQRPGALGAPRAAS